MGFPQQLTDAIGRTLFHSLWQGVLLAVLTGLIIVLTRSRKPTFRYNLLISAMVIFFIGTIVTFIYEFNGTHPIFIKGTVELTENKYESAGSARLFDGAYAMIMSSIFDFLTANRNTLVFIWLAMVCARSLQLTFGVNRLKQFRDHAKADHSAWGNKLNELAKQLGINQVVGFAESSLAKVPMVIGHLKPLILLPLGLLTALPPKEIEAILVHELAHISRRDYLVNILQSGMEILFFFNPAVLWLSSLIKTERENCCDDIAVGLTGDKMIYISALVSCQEYQSSLPNYAMTFNKKGQLKNRVIRLVYANNKSLNAIEKSILAFCLVIISLSVLAFSNEVKLEKLIQKTLTNTITKQPPVPSTRQELIVPKVKAAVLINTAHINHEDCEPQASEPITPIILAKLDSIRQPLLNEKSRANDSLVSLNHKKLARIDSIRQHSRHAIDTVKSGRLHNLSPLNIQLKVPISIAKSYKTYTDLSDLIKQELENDGIIEETDSKSSFMLNKQELIVNGKKQPEEVYEKYKAKYIPYVGTNSWALYRNYNSSRMTSLTQ